MYLCILPIINRLRPQPRPVVINAGVANLLVRRRFISWKETYQREIHKAPINKGIQKQKQTEMTKCTPPVEKKMKCHKRVERAERHRNRLIIIKQGGFCSAPAASASDLPPPPPDSSYLLSSTHTKCSLINNLPYLAGYNTQPDWQPNRITIK